MRRSALVLAILCSAAGAPAFAQVKLLCGQAQAGNVSANGTGTVFSFGVQAGDTMLIRVVPTTAGVTFNLPVLQDSGNATIPLPKDPAHLETFNAGGGYLTYDLAAPGTYYVTISGTSPGGYMIAYIPLNRPCSSNTGLSCGTPAKGSLDKGQIQTYQFNGKSGDAVLLNVTPLKGSDPNAALQIIGFDSSSHLQATGPQAALYGSTTQLAPLRYKLTSDGQQTFFIGEASGNLKLNYAISIVDFTTGCSATAVGCGSAVDGVLGDALANGIYSLSANKGDIYSLRLKTTDASGGLIAAPVLFDAQGAPVQPGPSTDPARAQYTLAAGGQYTVLVEDANGINTGKYSFSLSLLNGPCKSAQALGCGSAAGGQISGPVRVATYSLNAQANDVYLLRLLRTSTGSSFTPVVDIYGPDGTRVQTLTSSALGSVSFPTAAAGTYNIFAYDSDGSQSGSYALWVGRLNGPCGSSTALSCATAAAGSITQPLQAGVYSYPAAAGDSFTVRLVDGPGSLQSALQVYAPNTSGQPLPLASGNAKAVDVTNSPGGTYTVLVTDQSTSPQSGSFAVEAINTKGGCAASPPQGQTVSGLVSGPAPLSAYTFAASQGEPMLLRVASFTPGFAANMDLYDPSGRRIGSSTFRLPSQSLQAPATGNYTVVVGASGPRTAGSYAFSWQLLDQPVAPPLGCGQTTSGTLGPGSQFSYYTVNASDGDLLKLLFTRLPASANAQVELFDAGGAALKSSPTEINQKVSAGNYLVLVSPASANAETAGFALAMQKPNNPCSPLNLTCGQTLLQPVTVPGQLDTYTFSGNAGDQVAISVTPRLGSFSPVTELYNASGASLTSSPGSTTLNANLSAAGQYTLTIHDRSGANTGSYRVGLQHSNSPCPEDDSQKPTITLLRPTGGEVAVGGSVYPIAWQSDDNVAVTTHTIQLSTDGGKTFAPLPGGPGSLSGLTQSYAWTVPSGIAPTRSAVIQVTATDKGGNSQSAASDLLTLIGSGFSPNESITYSYDPLNRMVQATYGDGRVIFYNYDAAGNLVNVIVQ